MATTTGSSGARRDGKGWRDGSRMICPSYRRASSFGRWRRRPVGLITHVSVLSGGRASDGDSVPRPTGYLCSRVLLRRTASGHPTLLGRASLRQRLLVFGRRELDARGVAHVE